eukprot:5244441-Amphidinium_carterae.2
MVVISLQDLVNCLVSLVDATKLCSTSGEVLEVCLDTTIPMNSIAGITSTSYASRLQEMRCSVSCKRTRLRLGFACNHIELPKRQAKLHMLLLALSIEDS